MVEHGGSSAGSYLADPTSPIPSHCAVIILFKSVPVHQLSWQAHKELYVTDGSYGYYIRQCNTVNAKRRTWIQKRELMYVDSGGTAIYWQTCLKRPLKGLIKKWPLKTGSLLTQVNYSEKCIYRGLKGQSLNTGGLNGRFHCVRSKSD